MIRVRNRTDITQDMVRQFFDYNPVTGDLTRVMRYDSYKKLMCDNTVIRSKNNRGYYWVTVFGKTCLAHRLIWLYMMGEHPKNEIDHIDGNRLNNKWSNLRDVSSFDNARNQGNRKDNTSNCRGVHWSNRTNHRGKSKWCARISHKGKRYSLGAYDNYEDAVAARKQAEIDFGYHINHAKREGHHVG